MTNNHRARKQEGKRLDPANVVLWSDDELLVVNKPAGVLAVPGGYGEADDLQHILEPAFGRLWIVHRLDRDTSGVFVLARSPRAHRELNIQFSECGVSKTYHVLVNGSPSWTEQTLELALVPDGDRQHRTVVAGLGDKNVGAKAAVTQLQVLERLGSYALVEARPKTGRTHQVRVHLSAAGYPIVGDVLYGGGPGLFLSAIKPNYRHKARAERPLLGRVGLHAFELTIHHPTRGQAMSFTAPYPKDLTAALRQLRRYCVQ
jgi:RluA family pseudouridine synthase